MRLLASIFTVILVCCSNYSYAAHIIGGEMYYECLGYANNGLDTTKRSYKITIKLYRDCFASNAAGFDNPVLFTIYKERATGTGYDLVQTPARRQEFEMFLDGPFRVAAPTYPCLILPPNICVEEGRYVTTVDLPIISQEYVIVWQRCCRNNSITNLVTPEATGATFTINIHPESQRTCNSSPQFKSFPPTVVCVNNPLKFDHSAIDKEGDLLIYEFCEPLAGGGRTGGGCDAVVPTPDCPPPFKTAVFKTPFYNYTFPLGGNPKVTIDNITGLITGEPVELGQFVVGVCVSEYRNGVLLSKLRRDFQFNVASCEGTVVAGIQNGNLIGKKQYDILLCGTDQLQMVNNSYQQSYINSLLWTFENGGKIDSSTTWAPLIKFSEGGIHKGQLVLNPGSNCSDTVKYSVNVIPDLNSNFKVKYDTCNAGPVSFTSLASSTYSNIIDHNWALGDGYTAFTPNAEINYFRPGWYNIQYVVRDNFGCKSSSSTAVQWFPAPNVVIFEPTIREGCVPLKVDFKNISFPTDNSYKFVWKFSDSTVLNGFNVNHTFKDTGVYHLKLEVTSPHGCYKDGEFRDIVTVYNPPIAQWNISKKLINLKDPEIILEDISQKTIGRTWILNGNEHYFDQKLKFNYKDTGSYLIKMIVNDKFLCTDTLEDYVFVYRDFSLFMPNAFSPNGDGKNEVFVPFGQIHSLASYSLTVFDRWGAKIFNSSDPEVGWNGRFNNTGKDVPSGVYIYDLNYKVGNKPEFHERKNGDINSLMQKDTVGELFGALQEAFSIDANPKRAAAMSSYMRDQFQFYGIPSPKRKEIVKLVFENYKYDRQEFISLAKLLWAHPLRENQYVLFDLGYKWVKKMDISLIPFFEKLLVQKSWWDTVDGIGPNFIGKILLNHCSAEVRKKYAVNWNKSSNIWNIRTSIIFQLKYKDKLDFDLACTMILNHIDSKEFFIQKASGWILREYAKTHMTKVKIFVEGHALSNLTKREALKHA